MTEPEGMRPLSGSQRESLEEAVTRYEESVTVEAARWLLARGIDAGTAATFRLGVVTDPLPGHERYRGKLAIPYLHRDGYPLTIRFRCIEQHNCREAGHGKYQTMPGDRPRMYNTGVIARATDEIHVTEGEFDAMVLCKIGYPAVAIPGANNWAPHHRVLLAGFSRVWVWGDPDDAGADFVSEVCRSLRQAKGVSLRDGDVTETYLRGGANALHALIEKGRGK